MNRKQIEEVEDKLNETGLPDDDTLVAQLKRVVGLMNSIGRTLEERGYVLSLQMKDNSGSTDIEVHVMKEM